MSFQPDTVTFDEHIRAVFDIRVEPWDECIDPVCEDCYQAWLAAGGEEPYLRAMGERR